MKTPLSVQMARASWQVILISLIAIGMTLAVKRTDLPANLVGNLVIGAVLLCSLAFSIVGFRAAADDEDNAPRLRSNSLIGLAGVAVLLGLAIANNLGVFRPQAPIAAATPVPTPAGAAAVAPTAAPDASADLEAATAPTPVPVTEEEARAIARSYIALIKRGEFGEAYRYLPNDVQQRVTSQQHELHWVTAAGETREDLDVDPEPATQAADKSSIRFLVQIPEKDPQVLLVVGTAGKLSATPLQFVKP